MTGEIAIGGVLVPALLLTAVAALAVTIALTRLLTIAGFYRLVAWRPLVDVTLYLLVLGLLVAVTASHGTAS
jgi:hypothetical protein